MSGDAFDKAEKVTAAEFVRNFAKSRAMADKRPVLITNHSQVTHALLSADEYRRLASGVTELGADPLLEFGRWTTEALVLCDDHLQIVHANHVACAMFRRTKDEMIGRNLAEIPEVNGTLIEMMVRRTCVANEPTSAEIVSPFTKDAWIRLRSFPWRDQNLVMLRDMTEEVHSHRLADVKTKIIDCMSLHGGIGYVRLSVRGTIDRVDEPFAKMLGLPEERLIGVPIADLVAISGRVALRDALEEVFRGQGGRRLDVEFVTNRGDLVTVTLAVVQLLGSYGAEGAVMLLTSADSPNLDEDSLHHLN